MRWFPREGSSLSNSWPVEEKLVHFLEFLSLLRSHTLFMIVSWLPVWSVSCRSAAITCSVSAGSGLSERHDGACWLTHWLLFGRNVHSCFGGQVLAFHFRRP